MRGRSSQEVAALRWERQQAPVNKVVERVGNGQGPTGFHGDAGATQRSNDLEREEWISSRCLMNLREQRFWEGNIQVRLHDLVQARDIQRSHTDIDETTGAPREIV
jgi:hypothetical protein